MPCATVGAMFPIGDQNEPGHGPAIVTLALIAINIGVFLLLQDFGNNLEFTYGWSAIPLEITSNQDLLRAQVVVIDGQRFQVPQAPGPDPIQLTLLSSMFMHADLLHLGGNMVFLWVFGDNVEHRAGRVLFLVAYLGAGLAGSLAQILSSAASPIPTLGASGAISGVLGAYIVLFPGNRVTVFMFRFLTQVPALVAIGIWIAFQVFANFAAPTGEGGVAYLAHIGGFAAGVVAGLLFRALPTRQRLNRFG
jgi:rhomboid family protein